MAGLRYKVWSEHLDGMHYHGAYTTYAAAKKKADKWVYGGEWFTPSYGVGSYGDNVYIERNDGREIKKEETL